MEPVDRVSGGGPVDGVLSPAHAQELAPVLAMRARLKQIRGELLALPVVREAQAIRAELSRLLSDKRVQVRIRECLTAALGPALHDLEFDERPPERIVVDTMGATVRLTKAGMRDGGSGRAARLLESAVPRDLLEILILSIGPSEGATTRGNLDYFAGRESNPEFSFTLSI